MARRAQASHKFKHLFLLPKDIFLDLVSRGSTNQQKQAENININQLNYSDAEKVSIRHDIHGAVTRRGRGGGGGAHQRPPPAPGSNSTLGGSLNSTNGSEGIPGTPPRGHSTPRGRGRGGGGRGRGRGSIGGSSQGDITPPQDANRSQDTRNDSVVDLNGTTVNTNANETDGIQPVLVSPGGGANETGIFAATTSPPQQPNNPFIPPPPPRPASLSSSSSEPEPPAPFSLNSTNDTPPPGGATALTPPGVSSGPVISSPSPPPPQVTPSSSSPQNSLASRPLSQRSTLPYNNPSPSPRNSSLNEYDPGFWNISTQPAPLQPVSITPSSPAVPTPPSPSRTSTPSRPKAPLRKRTLDLSSTDSDVSMIPPTPIRNKPSRFKPSRKRPKRRLITFSPTPIKNSTGEVMRRLSSNASFPSINSSSSPVRNSMDVIMHDLPNFQSDFAKSLIEETKNNSTMNDTEDEVFFSDRTLPKGRAQGSNDTTIDMATGAPVRPPPPDLSGIVNNLADRAVSRAEAKKTMKKGARKKMIRDIV